MICLDPLLDALLCATHSARITIANHYSVLIHDEVLGTLPSVKDELKCQDFKQLKAYCVLQGFRASADAAVQHPSHTTC